MLYFILHPGSLKSIHKKRAGGCRKATSLTVAHALSVDILILVDCITRVEAPRITTDCDCTISDRTVELVASTVSIVCSRRLLTR
ncbi:hypothetical protein MUK42_36865 [Musa troglodytarum]|uniref:Uncharacterized protein n=1 Tax=Musa troglodytarum TaxID=320322 RepID=A0A9E7HIP7_9LILI|nr:hypothetical protein MUK42_36865 [Musa troglodytarum]